MQTETMKHNFKNQQGIVHWCFNIFITLKTLILAINVKGNEKKVKMTFNIVTESVIMLYWLKKKKTCQ